MTDKLAGSGRSLLAVAHLIEVILPAARFVIYARMMPSEEFGLAIALTLVFSAAELLTDFGLQQSILRSDPRDPAKLASYHSLALIRAFIVGLMLFMLAPVNAWLFSKPDVWLVFAILGLLFAGRGFVNLGIKQATRDFNFRPDAMVMILTQLVWTVATLAAALWLANHLVVLVGIAAAVLTQIVTSHRLSTAPFQLGWERQTVREAWDFGYPLLPNGVALAITSMGDRFVIGAVLGVRAMALYTPLIILAMMPRGNVLRYANSLLLPTFIASVEAGRSISGLLHVWSRILTMLGLALGLGIIAVAPTAIGVLFGANYIPPHDLTVLVAMLIYVRMLLGLPVPAALATGQTAPVTWGSLTTAGSLVPATVALWVTGRLEAFILTMVIVEAVSFIAIAVRVVGAHGARLGRMTFEWSLGAVLIMALAAAEWLQPMSAAVMLALAIGMGLFGIALLRGDRLLMSAVKGKSINSWDDDRSKR
jgi:O-antigen/teichoic acid export membrane protein